MSTEFAKARLKQSAEAFNLGSKPERTASNESLRMRCLELAASSISTPVDATLVTRAQAFLDFVMNSDPEALLLPETPPSETLPE